MPIAIVMAEKCWFCGKKLNKAVGHVNRAKKLGAKLFCNQKCFGLSYRSDETPEEKKDIKAWYDGFIRASMTDEEIAIDQVKRHEYYKKDYTANPAKYKKIRKKKQKKHNKYCRQPRYRAYKKEYDEKYRATKLYGDYGEAFIILKQIQAEVDNRMAQFDKGCFNKKLKRKRLWLNLQRTQKSSQQ